MEWGFFFISYVLWSDHEMEYYCQILKNHLFSIILVLIDFDTRQFIFIFLSKNTSLIKFSRAEHEVAKKYVWISSLPSIFYSLLYLSCTKLNDHLIRANRYENYLIPFKCSFGFFPVQISNPKIISWGLQPSWLFLV